MWTDPVVEEIHQIRKKMLADVGGDIEALMEKFRAHQDAHGGVVIEVRARFPKTAKEDKKSSTDQ